MMPWEIRTRPIKNDVKIPSSADPVKLRPSGSLNKNCSTKMKMPATKERTVMKTPIQPNMNSGAKDNDTKLFMANFTRWLVL